MRERGWRALNRVLWAGERMRWRIFHPVTAGVRVIFVRDGKVLLVEHTYREGWFLPGGGIDKGETFEEAARREGREEAGLDAADLRLFGLYTHLGQGKNDHIAVYVSEAFEETEPKANGEIARLGWFPLQELPAGIHPGAARRLAEYLAGDGAGGGRW